MTEKKVDEKAKPHVHEFKLTADGETKCVTMVDIESKICASCGVDHTLREYIKKDVEKFQTIQQWFLKVEDNGCPEKLNNEYELESGIGSDNINLPDDPKHKEFDTIVLQGLNRYSTSEDANDFSYRNAKKYLNKTLCIEDLPKFNYYIDLKGGIYEGAMLGKAEHTAGWDRKTIGIMYIANYMTYEEYTRAVDPMDWLKVPINLSQEFVDFMTVTQNTLNLLKGDNPLYELFKDKLGIAEKMLGNAIISKSPFLLDQALGGVSRLFKRVDKHLKKDAELLKQKIIDTAGEDWPKTKEIGGKIINGPNWAISKIYSLQEQAYESTAKVRKIAEQKRQQYSIYYSQSLDKFARSWDNAAQAFFNDVQDKFTREAYVSTNLLNSSLYLTLGKERDGALQYLSTATMLCWGMASPGYALANPASMNDIKAGSRLKLVASDAVMKQILTFSKPKLTSKYDGGIHAFNMGEKLSGKKACDAKSDSSVEKDLLKDDTTSKSKRPILTLLNGNKVVEVEPSDFIVWLREADKIKKDDVKKDEKQDKEKPKI